MVIKFNKIQKFDDIEVFLFLGFPKGYKNKDTFLVQFRNSFKEIKGSINIDIWRAISAGNVIYKEIINFILNLNLYTKYEVDVALNTLLKEGFIVRVGKTYSDVFESIKNYRLLRQGYRYDFNYNGESFAIRVEGEDKELDTYQRLIWKLADGKSTACDIIENINNQISKEFVNHNQEVATIKLAVAAIFCARNRYIYLI